MAATLGVPWLLQVEDDGNPGTYLTVGGQDGLDLNESLGTADTTTKDSNHWEEHIPAFRRMTAEINGIIDEANNVQDELEEMLINRVQKNIKIISAAGGSWTGKASLTEFTRSAAKEEAVRFTASILFTAAVTKVAA